MTINSALSLAYNQLSTLEGLNDFWSRFDTAFGTNYDAQWLAGDFSLFPQIKVVSDTFLGNASAAYKTESNTVYLSDSVFKTVTPSALNALILKEMGHFVEAKVNQSEYPGEAGKLFAQEGQGIGLSSSALKTIPLQQPFIAAATPVVYETITLSPSTNSYKYSGSNVIWVDSKGSNSVLKLYNGSTTTAIANSVYSPIRDYSISSTGIVWSKLEKVMV